MKYHRVNLRFSLLVLSVGALLNSCAIPKSLQVYTVATVTQPKALKKGTKDYWVSIIDYQIDSLTHLQGEMELDVNAHKLRKGEKFVLVYNKKDPSYYIVYGDKPIFLDTEATVETVGTIQRVSPLVMEAGVEYSYPVNGTQKNGKTSDKVYSKFQLVATTAGEKSRRRQYPDLKKGNKYLVKYSPADPQRAVIYLDKPL